MIAFRDVLEVVFPAVMFAMALAIISSDYRRKLRASGRKFKR